MKRWFLVAVFLLGLPVRGESKPACRTAAACIEAAEGLRKRFPEAPQAIVEQALALYERACSLGNGKACRKAGMLIRDRSPEPTRMRSAFGLGCTLEDAISCNELGMVLVKQRPTKARQLFQNACRLDHGLGCSNLAVAFRDGIGGKADRKKAETSSARACGLGHGDGCSIQALLLEKRSRSPQTASTVTGLMVKGCELGSATACTSAGTRYALGVGTSKSAAKAQHFLKRGCGMAYGPACHYLAAARLQQARTSMERRPAFKLLLRACQLKHMESCKALLDGAKRFGVATIGGRSITSLKTELCAANPGWGQCR